MSTPLTPIFVRALLLDALCHGNLRRQQIGAIDCWLWEWVPAYPLVSGAVEGARIGAGTAGKGSASGADSARSISLEAMAGHLELVTNWFRDGRIFPGHGVAADLRVEDLVAALDVLRDFLVASRQKGGSRQAREARMEAVQVLVGLPEILDDGFRSGGSGSEDDALLTAADLRGGNAADPIAGIAALFEPNIRMMDLMDASAGGIGLEYDDAATPLEVGTLLGVRLDPVQPVVLCEVVRRLAAPGRRSRIGTRVLQGDKRRIRLESAKWPKGIDAVFLAGEDPSGRGDTLVLSGTACDPEIVHEAALGGRNFHLRVSRVRRRGHGWAMAAFEFVDGPPQEEKPGGGASAR